MKRLLLAITLACASGAASADSGWMPAESYGSDWLANGEYVHRHYIKEALQATGQSPSLQNIDYIRICIGNFMRAHKNTVRAAPIRALFDQCERQTHPELGPHGPITVPAMDPARVEMEQRKVALYSFLARGAQQVKLHAPGKPADFRLVSAFLSTTNSLCYEYRTDGKVAGPTPRHFAYLPDGGQVDSDTQWAQACAATDLDFGDLHGALNGTFRSTPNDPDIAKR